jgi:hypothetical protein
MIYLILIALLIFWIVFNWKRDQRTLNGNFFRDNNKILASEFKTFS